MGTTSLASFAYDALGRKITAWTQYDVAGGGGDSQTSDLRFYHDGQVELADYHSDGTLARRFVNGTQYVDERVALIEGEADEADTFYYLLQELFTVTGLVEKNGALAEAAVYDGYGKVRLWDYSPGDFDRDGDVDATDQTTFTTAMGLGAPGTPTPDPSTDLDMDGDTDLTDAGLFNTIKNAGGAVAERFASSLGNPFHFTGRRLYMLETLPEADATPVANQQLQHNRARHYSPLEGRWLQRDPMEYVDGANLYEYVRTRPQILSDPRGMQSCQAWVSKAVFSDYEKTKLSGEVMLKLPTKEGGICHEDKEFKGVEVDFQIASGYATIKIVLIGGEDDSEMEIPQAGWHWRWPTLAELLGAVDPHDFSAIDIAGVACKKREICVRECQRVCCCEEVARTKQKRTYKETTWVHGTKYQDWYGVIVGGGLYSSRVDCKLFGPGERVRISGSYFKNPGNRLDCNESSVPPCPN